jgi:hypothetical protein
MFEIGLRVYIFKRLRRQWSCLSHIQSFMRTLVSSLLRVLSFTGNLGLET